MKYYTVALLIILLAGCSKKMVEVEGVQCIQTINTFGDQLSCNWEKYNEEQKATSSS